MAYQILPTGGLGVKGRQIHKNTTPVENGINPQAAQKNNEIFWSFILRWGGVGRNGTGEGLFIFGSGRKDKCPQ